MGKDHDYKKQSKRGCPNHKEIEEDEILDVICQETYARSVTAGSAPQGVLDYRRLRDSDAEFPGSP